MGGNWSDKEWSQVWLDLKQIQVRVGAEGHVLFLMPLMCLRRLVLDVLTCRALILLPTLLFAQAHALPCLLAIKDRWACPVLHGTASSPAAHAWCFHKRMPFLAYWQSRIDGHVLSFTGLQVLLLLMLGACAGPCPALPTRN
jgi:hypothetical protein